MEGEHQGNCTVCGEEVKSAPSSQENGEISSLLQSYLSGISCHLQEGINFADLDGLVACDSCSSKINSLQHGKETFEGLRKEVSEAERNLHRKLTDMETVGQKVLRESKEIEKLIMNRIQKKDLGFGQEVVILRKGTEKASLVMKETMRELKVKRSCVKTWACGVDSGNEAGTSSSSSEEICGFISSVASLADRNDDFEASEVFQVKTEQEQNDGEENDNVSTGEPVPECVVKVEEGEEIRRTRRRVIYGNMKVTNIPFEALPNKMLPAASNQESTEYEVIDLEAEVSNELPGLQEETFAGDSTEGCEEGTKPTVRKRTLMEVDRDQREVQVEESRQKVTRRSASPGSHKNGTIVKESPNGCGTEYSDHAATPVVPMQVELASEEDSAPEESSSSIGEEEEMLVNAGEVNEPGNDQNDTMSETDEADSESSCEEVELSTDENEADSSDEMNTSLSVKETLTGKTAKTDTEKAENEMWFSDIMLSLSNSKNINMITLRQRLHNIPSISSDLFHKLVVKLKEVGKTEALNVSGVHTKPAIYQITKNVEVEQRTLDILFQAGVDFNALNNKNQNVLFAAIEGNRSVSFINNLITRGVNENQINAKGQNLLVFAAEKGCSLEVFEFLVNKGEYLNGWDEMENPYGTIFYYIRDSSDGAYQKRLCLLKALVNTRNDVSGQEALKHFMLNEVEVGTIRTAEEFHDVVQFIFSSKDRLGWFDTEYEPDGLTVLHLALWSFEIGEEAFEMLVKAQCNFKKVDNDGHGTLHRAMLGGSCPWILKKLIEQGADVNIKLPTEGNRNLLHYAVCFDCKVSLETLEFLIEKGLDITALDSDGYTVLEKAVKFKTVDANILTWIFIWSFDAGLRHLNKSDASIVHFAAEYGTPAALDYILEKAVNVDIDINEIDKHGLSLFETAICSANENEVENAKVLIKFGADSQFKKGERKTTLHHLSVLSDTASALRFCLEELRLDVNATDMNGMTPLLTIIYRKFFLRRYTNNDRVESEFEKLNILLENGADVNAKPNRNFLVYSSFNRDRIVKNITLQTPLHLALQVYLMNPTSKSSPQELIKLLLRIGANVNEPTLEGWTAIHIVIGWKNLDPATLILLTDLFGDRVDYSAKTLKGQTALHLATENRNIDSIRFCLEKGLDVNDLDEEGKTPLDTLVPKFWQQKVRVKVLLDAMQLLLENGATSNTKQKAKENIEARWNTDTLHISKPSYRKLLALFN